MSRVGLTDAPWELIAPLLPPPKRTGRPRVDDRQTWDAILYVRRTGCRWQALPREYGAAPTAWRRWRTWEEQGVWERIWRAVLASLDARGRLEWAQAVRAGACVPAQKGEPKSA